MKAKHLLFGSIFLSMGFAACTNEVEEFAPQAQDKDFPGVELGKDFSISVTNADFSADAATRAAFEKVGTTWVASWQENDAIGAAWFNKFVYDNTGKVVSDSRDVWTNLGEYGSNAEFVWQGGTTFESEAISKLGAYVLYYPYNEKITDNMTEIPVVGIPATQPFDVQNPTKQVTANMTAANVVVFGESGNQAPEFTVKQVPNLYALSFFITDEALLKLDQKVQITHVMLEAENHTAVFNTAGTIAPSTTKINPNTYNGVPGADPMPVISFTGATEKADRIIIEVANEGNNSDYYIRNTGKDNGTAKFYFSLLPTEKLTSNVTFKIIGKVREGGKYVTKVFAKTVELTDAHKAKDTGFAWKMSDKGQVINLAVELDNTMIESGIYSVEQFVENWVAGDKEFNLAIPMDLTKLTAAQQKKVNFNLPEATHITFEGQKVTLPSISGKYTFKNDVEIIGSAVVSGCDEDHSSDTDKKYIFCKSATIENDLTVTGPVTANIAKVNVGGNATLGNAKFTSYGNSVFEGDVVVEGDVEFNKATTIKGALTIKEEATVNAKANLYVTGDIIANGILTATKDLTAANLTANAAVTVAGKSTVDAIEANAVVTMDKATVKGNIVANEAVTINGDAEVTGTITADAPVTIHGTAKTGYITANEEVEIKGEAIDVAGVTANETVTFAEITKIGNIVANVPLNFTKTIAEAGDITANANINFATVAKAGNITVGTTEEAVITANTITAANVTVDKAGEFYAKNMTVTVKLTANGKVEGLAAGKQNIAELFIADGITVDLKGTSTIATLTVDKVYSFFGKLNVENATITTATNNGEVNGKVTVNGEFNQNNIISGNYTVAKDATLKVNANATLETLTNNGAVVVAEGVTLAAAAGENNAAMTVNGTVDADALVYGPESDIIVGAKGNLSNGTINGTVTIVNDSKVNANVTAAEVIYNWNGTDKPKTNVALINTLNLTDATYDKNVFTALAALTKINVAGAWNLSGTIDIAAPVVVNVIADATFAATKATNLTIQTANVSEGVTLTVGEKVNLAGGNYYMASGSKFVGNKGAASVAY